MTYIACEMALIQSLLCEMGVASSSAYGDVLW